jgi:O-acetyl-ADP-ribose deacetylase (regulator of RNase III)
VDTDAEVVAAWRVAFEPFNEVMIQQADLLAVAHNAVVSPSNAHGFMDGGIDLSYVRFFGPGIEALVQEAISKQPEGHLPVGASLVVETGHTRIPYLILAPTMLMPEMIPSQHCYRAMRAILRLAGKLQIGDMVFCPGLGTGVGSVPPKDAAQEMARAYQDWKIDQTA